MFRRAIGRLTAVVAVGLLPASLLLATPASAAEPTATFAKSSDWGTGYAASYTINNAGDTAINGWTLVFDLGPNQTMSSLWNGSFSQSGSTVTVQNTSWNGDIAPGGSVNVGFNVAYTGTFVDPANCTLNGASCAGGGGGGPGEPGDDTEAPSAPTDLTPVTTTSSSVTLSWTASTDNVGVTGYNVFRDGVLAGTTAQTSFTVGRLSPEREFAFVVRAVDAAGNISDPSNEVRAATRPVPGGGGGNDEFRTVAYFTQWGIYARNYFVKDIVESGTAANVDVINYAFANVNQAGTCFEANQLGQGDAWADYQRRFNASQTVSGEADQFNQPLAGNFNQLLQLKQQFPHIKVLMSIGGWTWSKWLSDAAATAASRQQVVSSCIDLFLRGNLPKIGGAPQGGPGSAFGVFDGFDIDWEWPGSEGKPGNVIRPQDKQNYTLLLAEFRRQMDQLEQETGREYFLSAFLPADPAKVEAGFEVPEIFNHLDWATVQGYDLHGAWESTTNHQSNTVVAAGDPSPPELTFSSEIAINAYLSQGAPANELILGVPFYSRGWTGVNDANNGLFQPATGPAPGRFEAGVDDYDRVVTFQGFTLHRDPSVGTAWLFNGTTFWTFDDPTAMLQKMEFVRSRGLGGAMAWSLDGDTEDGDLFAAIAQGLS